VEKLKTAHPGKSEKKKINRCETDKQGLKKSWGNPATDRLLFKKTEQTGGGI